MEWYGKVKKGNLKGEKINIVVIFYINFIFVYVYVCLSIYILIINFDIYEKVRNFFWMII